MVDITSGAVTWTISGSPVTGTFVNGDPYVVDSGSGVTITARTPAPTGSGTTARNGGMINPKHQSSAHIYHHGYDGRVSVGLTYNSGAATFGDIFQYRDQDNAELSFPITLYAGQSLCSSGSGNPGGGIPGGATATAMQDMSVLTILSSDPGTGLAFRPPYSGDTKPLWLKSQVDYSKLPRLTPPIADPTTGGFPLQSTSLARLERVNYSVHANTNIGVRAMRPTNNLVSYPRDQAAYINQAIAYMLCDFGGLEEGYADKLIQLGIDNYGVIANSGFNGCYYGGAGFGFGALFPILFAGFMLNDSGMLSAGTRSSGDLDYWGDPVPPFQEQANTWYSPNAYDGYLLPRLRSSYPNGVPLYGDPNDSLTPSSNHAKRDPAGKYDGTPGTPANPTWYPYPVSDVSNTWNNNGGDYMAPGSAQMVMPALAARLMGFMERYDCPAMFDYVDRFADDWGLMLNFNNPGQNFTRDSLNGFRRDIAMGGTGNGFCMYMWDQYRYPGGKKILLF